MRKVKINRMSIEITRRCNMKCPHCMRGSAQNIDINPDYIDNILRYTKEIGYLNLTGGEPSMNAEAIKYIYKTIKRRKIPVQEFHIITNGSETSISNDFIDICSKLYSYQSKESYPKKLDCILEMSNDLYHDNNLREKVHRILSHYPFFSNRYKENDSQGVPLIKQGRSKEGMSPVFESLYLSGNEIYGCVYLNALGHLIGAGDLSYKNQEKEIICDSGCFFQYVKTTEIR